MGFLGLRVAFCFGIAAGTSIRSRTASQRADTWLLEHTSNPDVAGLKDLKGSDPDAYAIVTSLLAKGALGTLELPGSSRRGFKEEAEARGLTSTTDGAASIASVPYPSVGSRRVDPFSYRPSRQDEMIASSVLQASPSIATASLANHRGPAQISLDWGNAYAGTSNRGNGEAQHVASKRLQQIKAQDIEPASSGSASKKSSLLVSRTRWTDSSLSADAAVLGTEMVVQEETSKNEMAQTFNALTDIQKPMPSMRQDTSQVARKFAGQSTDQDKSDKSDWHQTPRSLEAIAEEMGVDDDDAKSVVNGPGKQLSRFLDVHFNNGTPVAAMTQKNVEVGRRKLSEDDDVKFKHWLDGGQKKPPPAAQSTNPYLLDLKSAIPASANLNLLVAPDAVPVREMVAQDDDTWKMHRWLDSDKRKASKNVNTYLIDLKST